MQFRSIFDKTRRARRLALAASTWLLISHVAAGQNVPLISGGGAFFAERNQGDNSFQPIVSPLIAAPLGSHLLVESRADLRQFYLKSGDDYNHVYTATLQYLQLDYLANSRLTIVGGKFLIPFGTYNERLAPVWIGNFQDFPIIYGIGLKSNAGNGGMVRGAIFSKPKAQLNYAAYFSGSSTNVHQFKATRVAGYQLSTYFPHARLEIGMSYQRFLQQVHNDSTGVHVWWQPPNSAYSLRSEYAHGDRSQGYWIENSYRLSRFGGANSIVGRFEPLFRMQQSFRNQKNFPGQSDGLPSVDTQQLDFGFDYHLPKEFRLNSSYSRSFATVNKNIWGLSLTYRFLVPTWGGHK